MHVKFDVTESNRTSSPLSITPYTLSETKWI